MWIIIIIILILIGYGISRYWRYKPASTFWKYQPVSRTKDMDDAVEITKGHLITQIMPSAVSVKQNLELHYLDLNTTDNLQVLSQFLNQNYVFGYKYSPEFLQWSINIPELDYIGENKKIGNRNIKNWNIILKEKRGDVVGSIISKPVEVCIQNFGHSPCVYVDYLSVKKTYRSQKLAPILISHTVKNCWEDGYRMFIFKKEGNPLPFKVICETHFYLLPIKNIQNMNLMKSGNYKISSVDYSNLKATYHFFQKSMQKYSLYPVYSLSQFRHLFTNSNIVRAWVLQQGEEIVGFTAFAINQFQMYTLKYQIAEIIYYIAPVNSFHQLFYKVLQEAHALGLDKITLIDIMENYKLIEKFQFQQSMKLNFQMYNYHHPNSIAKKDFAYNVL